MNPTPEQRRQQIAAAIRATRSSVLFFIGAVLTSAAVGVAVHWPYGVLTFGALLILNAYIPVKATDP